MDNYLYCEKCMGKFSIGREPMLLLPCKHTVCSECIDYVDIDEEQVCRIGHCPPIKIEHAGLNVKVLELIKFPISKRVYCERHRYKKAKIFCKDIQQFICNICFECRNRKEVNTMEWEQEQMTEIGKEIKQFSSYLQEKCSRYEQLGDYLQNPAISLNGKTIFSEIKEAYDDFKNVKLYNPETETSAIDAFVTLTPQHLIDKANNLQKRIIQQSSFISQKQAESLCELISVNISNFKLLYRGSEHKFSSESFQKVCDCNRPMLFAVRTCNGKVICGYTQYNQQIVQNGSVYASSGKIMDLELDNIYEKERNFSIAPTQELNHMNNKFLVAFGGNWRHNYDFAVQSGGILQLNVGSQYRSIKRIINPQFEAEDVKELNKLNGTLLMEFEVFTFTQTEHSS